MLVSEIKQGEKDAVNGDIIAVYTRHPPEYAVYRTKERVMVHYADDPARASAQATALAPLNPLRGEINGLIDGWRSSKDKGLSAKAVRYDRRVADSLRVALEGDSANAVLDLARIRTDIVDERISWARFQYLLGASAVSIAVILLVWILSTVAMAPPAWTLWFSLAGGTIGAFFSIAIAIRKRTVLTDLNVADNLADAVLRILIGAIAAGVLVSLLQMNAITLTVGEARLDDATKGWLAALVVAFVAGFSERLIPDLLERSGIGQAEVAVPAVAPAAGAKEPQEAFGAKAANDAGAAKGAEEAPATRAGYTLGGVAPVVALHEAEQHEDHCLCDLHVDAQEVTSDEDLPAATGGVAAPRMPVTA